MLERDRIAAKRMRDEIKADEDRVEEQKRVVQELSDVQEQIKRNTRALWAEKQKGVTGRIHDDVPVPTEMIENSQLILSPLLIQSYTAEEAKIFKQRIPILKNTTIPKILK